MYNPKACEFFISRDIVFYKDIFPYAVHEEEIEMISLAEEIHDAQVPSPINERIIIDEVGGTLRMNLKK